MHHDAQKLTTTGFPRRSAIDSVPSWSSRSRSKAGACDDLAARELVGGAVLVAERDLPDQQCEQRGDSGERDDLADALDGALAGVPGHALTMNTGVPTSTWSKSHSTCGISMRTQPCDAE